MDNKFQLGPENLPFPNGGGFKKMTATPQSHKLELAAMKARHASELAKLKEKQASLNKKRFTVPKKTTRRNQGR